MTPSVVQKQTQTVVLAPQLRQGLRLLAMGLPELRGEILREMNENPVIEDIGGGQDDAVVLTDGQGENAPSGEGGEEQAPGDGAVDVLGMAYLEGVNRGAADPEAVDRRERFFSNQASEESLDEHLLRQIPVSGIAESDYGLAEMLIGELDGDDYFRGSMRDIVMVSGESEEKIRGLLRRITHFDPPGCGATTLEECLTPQLDTIRDEVLRERVRGLLHRLDDIAYVRSAAPDVVAALRSLNPRPGSAFRRSRYEAEYVRPEVHAVRCADGNYRAVVDDRGIPTIRISKKCLKMLEDPSVDEATKAYIKERLTSVRNLIDAVERRHDTITAIAQAIFDAQPGFFRDGMDALRPLTMQQVADEVGVHHTTVSRTVRGKYVSTPKGTFELRRFFTSGVVREDGEAASVTTVLQRLKEMVLAEDVEHPLSDDRLSRQLKKMGYEVARRTVAKYRTHLGIPSASKRAVRHPAASGHAS